MPSPSPGASTPDTSGGALIPSEPTGPELTGDPVTSEDADDSFVVTITAAQDRYRAGQLIDTSATLEYVGPDAEAIARGSSHSLVGFALEGGDPPVVIHAASTGDCAGHRLARGEPLEFPFAKSGGFEPWNPEDAFAEAYFADQELRLPAGTWTISAGSSFYTGADCGDELHSLTAALTLTVEP